MLEMIENERLYHQHRSNSRNCTNQKMDGRGGESLRGGSWKNFKTRRCMNCMPTLHGFPVSQGARLKKEPTLTPRLWNAKVPVSLDSWKSVHLSRPDFESRRESTQGLISCCFEHELVHWAQYLLGSEDSLLLTRRVGSL